MANGIVERTGVLKNAVIAACASAVLIAPLAASAQLMFKGSLTWQQEHPNHLKFCRDDGATLLLTRGSVTPGVLVAPEAARGTRLPPGHPEGFIEGFANVYTSVADEIEARKRGERPRDTGFPTVADGARGVMFIDAAVRSHKAGGAWVSMAM